MKNINLQVMIIAVAAVFVLSSCSALKTEQAKEAVDLWKAYDQNFRNAKYVDMSHTISPQIPTWEGFGPPVFGPSMNPQTGKFYNYKEDGFEATRYILPCDQLGTHIDAPAHWAPEYPATDEIPPTFAIRPLVVVSIAAKVAQNPNYHL
jgi:kynurenine formamidase